MAYYLSATAARGRLTNRSADGGKSFGQLFFVKGPIFFFAKNEFPVRKVFFKLRLKISGNYVACVSRFYAWACVSFFRFG